MVKSISDMTMGVGIATLPFNKFDQAEKNCKIRDKCHGFPSRSKIFPSCLKTDLSNISGIKLIKKKFVLVFITDKWLLDLDQLLTLSC